MHTITFTTDFGLQDWFVGTMKGVILRINSRVRIVDLTHGVPAGGIQAGAFALAAGFAFFPCGTVHLAVVDPGVGTARAAIAIQTRNYWFVGPDNGVLSLAVEREGGPKAIHRIENPTYLLKTISRTFHGRDIFAPAAAHLSKGLPVRALGPGVSDYLRLTLPPAVKRNGRTVGVVVYIDRFGNAITNLAEELPVFLRKGSIRIRTVRRRGAILLCSSYQGALKGKPLAILGSTGFLEIAINGGSAARSLGLRVGDEVVVEGA